MINDGKKADGKVKFVSNFKIHAILIFDDKLRMDFFYNQGWKKLLSQGLKLCVNGLFGCYISQKDRMKPQLT